MHEIKFECTQTYDYTPEFLTSYKDKIKKAFSEACKRDLTLSSEYQKYVSDPSHIEVELTPHYAYDVDVFLHSIKVEYEYDYSFTYQSGSHVSGEVKFDSYGDGHLSAHTVSDYSTSYEHDKGTLTLYSTAMKKYRMHFGTAVFRKEAGMAQVSSKTARIPAALKSLQTKKFDEAFLNAGMKPSALPDGVFAEVKEWVLKYHHSASHIRITKVLDYWVDEAYLTFFPEYCEFSLRVTFDGKTYTVSGKNLKGIKAKGPESTHHAAFEKEVSHLRWLYDPKDWPVKRYGIISGILATLLAIGY